MSKTVTDLAKRVLTRLEEIAPGDTPSADQLVGVRDFYYGTFAELETQGIVSWDRDTIPEHIFLPLADFVAGRMATDFGKSRPDLEASGDARLRAYAGGPANGLPVLGSYF